MNPHGCHHPRSHGANSLVDNEVCVWRASLNQSASEIGGLKLILSSEELERAERFHFEADWQRSIIGHGCLRLLLGKILDLPANSLRFEYEELGKPRLVPIQEKGLRFNVSHSGDQVLIAITKGRAVGVDVERIRADLDLDGLAARFFSTNERIGLASLTGPEKYEAFFTCWTRKEAYLKARGDGLSMPLDQFDVSIFPDQEARLLKTRHDPGDVERWTLQPVGVPAGYVATVAAAGSDWKLRCQDWPLSPLSIFKS
jgi:4'-phosphopantetheinyl transferase